MAIPVNGEGEFEAVTGGGDVVGHGRVRDGWVEFVYGDDDQHATVVPTAEFETTWAILPNTRDLTLRAAA